MEAKLLFDSLKRRMSTQKLSESSLPVIESIDNRAYKKSVSIDLEYGFFKTPFGGSLLSTTKNKIVFFGFDSDKERLLSDLKRRFSQSKLIENKKNIGIIVNTIMDNPRKINNYPLYLKGSNFQIKIWKTLLTIPFSSVVSYKQISDRAGYPNAARAVGAAIGANPISFLIPCHRVLRANGEIGGYYWGTDKKRMMLGWESNYT